MKIAQKIIQKKAKTALKEIFLAKRIFITDSSRVNNLSIIKNLPKGTIVIFRDYQLNEDDRILQGQKIAKICRKRRLKFIVAKDYNLALKLKAEGIHIPQFAQNKIKFLRKTQPKWLISSTCHDVKALKKAEKQGADIALVSPIFKTTSSLAKKPIGIFRFARLISRTNLPVFALGGIKKENIKRLKNTRCYGIAGVSLFC